MASAAAASTKFRRRQNRDDDDESSIESRVGERFSDEEIFKNMPRTYTRLDDYRKILYKKVNDDIIVTFVIVLIGINSILMGVNTYLPEKDSEEYVEADETERNAVDAISEIDFIFLILFTIELGINVLVYLHYTLMDGWLAFDLFTILTSWLFDGFTIMRSFRIFRVFRLFGRVPALKKIVSAIASTTGTLGSIVFVLFILCYIFAVMMTMLFKECWELGCYRDTKSDHCLQKYEELPFDGDSKLYKDLMGDAMYEECLGVDFFGRLDFTFFTLMQLMTQDDWANIVKMTEEEYSWAWIPICVFMTISAIVMLNLVIAVLCQALNDLKESDSKEKDEKEEPEEYIVKHETVDISTMETSTLVTKFIELYDEKDKYVEEFKAYEKFMGEIEAKNKKLEELITALYIKRLPQE